MIDGKSFFDQPVKNNIRTYNNNLKIYNLTNQGELLFHLYCYEDYKI